ncbi:ABC transporter permease [Pseudoalteromonas sp. A25]|uniref:ABC transporter permease n=1 Tax=Pseudoalteromonas sp. A25 TaxID=116092 RepID=UPI00129F38E6|nr:FtsX-like permease family protein [Pseudoalteromonas sp. A25]BBN83828.1 ABC transporter permease [Pseudoalteromonas sp. A25]
MLNNRSNQTLNVWALSLQQAVLLTKQKQNWLTLACLGVLFFYLSFVTLIAQGVDNYLKENLKQLLGADSVIQINRTIPREQLTALNDLVDKSSQSQLYKITLTHQTYHQQVQLKAVDDNYPLQGKLEYSQDKSFKGKQTSSPPDVTQIWLEPRLASALNVNIGDTLTLGHTQLIFSAYLLHEPDRLHEGHSSDMRALVHSSSIQAEDLAVKQYRYLFNHNESNIHAIENIQKTMADSQLFSKALGNHPISAAYQRVEKFLGLLSVLLIILAGITLLLSSHKTSNALSRFIAVCLSNGMNAKYKFHILLSNSLFTLLLSFIPALIFALISAVLFEQSAQKLMPGFMLIWQPFDLLKVLFLCSLLFVGLSLPMWFKVYRTQPIELLSAHSAKSSHLSLHAFFLCTMMAGIVYWYSDNWTLTALLLGSLAVCILGLLLVSTLVLNLGRWGLGKHGKLLGFTLYLMRQRIYVRAAQMMSLGLSITLLLMCARIHQDITSMLEHFKYEQQGNLLITQVDQKQKEALEQFLVTNNSELKELYKYQYAQLTHINNVPLNMVDIPVSDTLSSVQKPIRLHWSEQLPVNNKLELGDWLNSLHVTKSNNISVEDEVFNELNLKLGDQLIMQMAEKTHSYTVASVHSFASGGSNITFWFVAQTSTPVPEVPVYSMGSAELSKPAWQQLAKLWQTHPTMRLQSIDSILSQTRNYLNVLTGAVFMYSGLISVLTILLLSATIQRHLQQDKKRNGLLVSFGLSKIEQYKIASYEWLVVTLLPTISAFACVYLTMGAFYKYELALTYKPDHITLLMQALLIVFIITALGLLSTKKQFTNNIRGLLVE